MSTHHSDDQPAEPIHNVVGSAFDDEPNEEHYFTYSASLLIFGDQLDFAEISQRLGLAPYYSHRKGDRRSAAWPGYTHDMWSYKVPLPKEQALAEHVTALWADIKHAEGYLRSLKEVATVDIFLGYRSNADHAGVVIPHTCLEMFTVLEIPFGLSIIIT